jgi:hypothetical protein
MHGPTTVRAIAHREHSLLVDGEALQDILETESQIRHGLSAPLETTGLREA